MSHPVPSVPQWAQYMLRKYKLVPITGSVDTQMPTNTDQDNNNESQNKVDARLRLEGQPAREFYYVKRYRGILTETDLLRFLVKSEYQRIKEIEDRVPNQIPEHARKTIIQVYEEDEGVLRAMGIESVTEFYNSLVVRGLDTFLAARKEARHKSPTHQSHAAPHQAVT